METKVQGFPFLRFLIPDVLSTAPVVVRPASPLPPNVPTGPRNQNKYKDRDGNAPAVDGLDYGGGKDLMGRRTPSGEPEERISSRWAHSIEFPSFCMKPILVSGNDEVHLVWMISEVPSAVEISPAFIYISIFVRLVLY